MKTRNQSTVAAMKYQTGSPLISQLPGANHLMGKDST
jgi:hypothetical protein